MFNLKMAQKKYSFQNGPKEMYASLCPKNFFNVKMSLGNTSFKLSHTNI